jgi:hypothetical protein
VASQKVHFDAISLEANYYWMMHSMMVAQPLKATVAMAVTTTSSRASWQAKCHGKLNND